LKKKTKKRQSMGGTEGGRREDEERTGRRTENKSENQRSKGDSTHLPPSTVKVKDIFKRLFSLF
jgi:hypothetical protein